MNAVGRIIFGLILALPIVMMGQWSGTLSPQALTKIFDGLALQRLSNSLQLAFYTSLFAGFFSIPVFMVYLITPPSKRLWLQAAALLPFSIPPFAMASAWMTLAGWAENPGGRIIWGAESAWEHWLYSVPGAAFILALCYWPVIFFYLALSGIPSRRTYEAALLYMPFLMRLRRYWFPILRQAVMIPAAFIFGLTLLQFEAPSLLLVDVYPLEIYVQFSALMDEGAAFALCIPYLLLVPFMAWIFVRGRNLGRQGAGSVVQVRMSSLGMAIVYFVMIAIFICSIATPFSALIMHACRVDSIWVEWHRHLWTAFLTMLYASVTSVIIFALGLWLYRIRSRWERSLWLIVGLACFVMPGVLISACWLEFRTLWPGWLPIWVQTVTLIAGYTVHFWVLGFAAAILFWNRYGDQQQEADALLPLSNWKRIRSLYAPAWFRYCPPIMFVMGLFVWCDASVTALLHPPGGETLAVRYYNLLHYGSEPRTAALGLLLLLLPMILMLICLLGLNLFRRRDYTYE